MNTPSPLSFHDTHRQQLIGMLTANLHRQQEWNQRLETLLSKPAQVLARHYLDHLKRQAGFLNEQLTLVKGLS